MGGLCGLHVRHCHVLHRAPDGLVPEALFDQGEVNISRDEMRGQRVFEGVRMPLLWRKSDDFAARLEDAEKLRAVKPAALLRREKEIRPVSFALALPGPESHHFVEQRLALVPIKRLNRVERAL